MPSRLPSHRPLVESEALELDVGSDARVFKYKRVKHRAIDRGLFVQVCGGGYECCSVIFGG